MKETSNKKIPEEEFEYVGFWLRVLAALIDSAWLMLIIVPVLWKVYGQEYFSIKDTFSGPVDVIMTWIFPIAIILIFWVIRSATPGKMVISAKIVDARTGEKPSHVQFLIRYLGYYISAIPFLIGLIWVAFDKRKQGWHDKLAKTVVIRQKKKV